MSKTQHEGARALLNVLKGLRPDETRPSYGDAALLLGRPQSHARAVAQMCDLLDAAACLAGVPLLALIEVRQGSGEINPKAWKKEYGPRRDSIITRSLNHRFEAADFDKIGGGLSELSGKGNRIAWSYLSELYPGELLYRRLLGIYDDSPPDAINDIGADNSVRFQSEAWSYPRDAKVREAVLIRAKGRCEHCDERGFVKPDGSRYLESHHVIALANEGADRITNVIALCANDHREAHFGERQAELEQLMIAKLKMLNS